LSLRQLRYVLDERPVDLDHVEWITCQTAQRRRAGAEIVHGEPHAQGAQLVHDPQRGFRIAHDFPLGDFQLQTVGRQS
jgi:hypothetical protein